MQGSNKNACNTRWSGCSIVLIGLVVYAALGPADWQLRIMLGWKTEHALGFFLVAFVTCVAWRRPVVGGAALAATASSSKFCRPCPRKCDL